jgi:hypothetical protein
MTRKPRKDSIGKRDPLKVWAETIYKNEYVFVQRMIRKKSELFRVLEALNEACNGRRTYWCPEPYGDFARRLIHRDELLLQSLQKLMQLPQRKFLKLVNLINNKLLPRYGFGPEWENAFISAIMIGIPLVPDRSFTMKPGRDVQGKQFLNLMLGPATSIDEIRSAWPEIKKEQQKLWPGFKRVNVGKTLPRSLFKYVQYLTLKEHRTLSTEEKIVDLTDYEKLAYRQYGVSAIKQHRRGKGLSSHLKTRNKKTIPEIVRSLFSLKSRKTVYHKVGALRKQHERMSKKSDIF